MFRRLTEPLPLSEASLLLLRPAMNTPVLNLGYLPVGPARAAVVAFAEEYGGIGIALGIRSNESGQLAVIRNQESIDFDVRLVDAIEPLLAEAERMGFLFDEDMLQTASARTGHAEAMVHWAGLMGGMESLIPPRKPERERTAEAEEAERAGPLSPSLAVEESQYPELILDDVAPLVLTREEAASNDDETFEEDLAGESDPEDLDADLEESLDDVLDEWMADGLDDAIETGLETDEGDWESPQALMSELDLTEPTAPILPTRAPAPVARPAASVAAAPKRVFLAPAKRPAPVEGGMPQASSAPPPRTPAVEAPKSVAPAVVLSKFRHAGGLAPGSAARSKESEVGADRSAELARIPIVRVRRDVEKKVPFLARLLSSF